MLFGVQRTYRFLINPVSVNNDLYYDLSLAPAGFWAHVRSDGGDIRVTAQDGTTQLPREVSGFDYAGHKGSLFIGMGAATACYVYYGNPSATEPAANSAYGKYAVWESAAKLVAHLEDTNDSTSNQNNLTPNGSPALASAKVNKGYTFTPSNNDWLTLSSTITADTNMTYSAWVNWVSGNSSVFGKDGITTGYVFLFYTGGASLYVGNDTVSTQVSWTITPLSGFHSLVLVKTGTILELFIDNISQGTQTLSTVTPVMYIGHAQPASTNFKFNGTIDETRIYSRALSPTEIATMYANQNDPASFWTTGAEK